MSLKDSQLSVILKRHGLRSTRARSLVLASLQSTRKGPTLTAQDIHNGFLSQKPSKRCDLVSVYRALELFEDLGLVHRCPDGSYGLCTHSGQKPQTGPHLHLLLKCLKCSRTEESKVPRSIERQLQALSFSPTKPIFAEGICQSCS